ncbi:hypothetical protein DEALK_01830 [Dehalogenimonas alkenigignens]|nr:hypothetical protein [Dehalogenimonas alkenigignens]KTB49271.1 hypothetical protein DEALK_01830 [Dehalogenimonas alkenigignens]
MRKRKLIDPEDQVEEDLLLSGLRILASIIADAHRKQQKALREANLNLNAPALNGEQSKEYESLP